MENYRANGSELLCSLVPTHPLWPDPTPLLHSEDTELIRSLCVTVSFHYRGESTLGMYLTKYACTGGPGLGRSQLQNSAGERLHCQNKR